MATGASGIVTRGPGFAMPSLLLQEAQAVTTDTVRMQAAITAGRARHTLPATHPEIAATTCWLRRMAAEGKHQR